MTFVLVAAIVVALALFVLLMLTRRNAAEAASEASKRHTTLSDSANTYKDDLHTASADLDTAQQALDAQTAIGEELQTALSQSQEREAGLQSVADELSETEQQAAERIAVLEIDVERLNKGMSQIEPQTLWELELQRSERTWRYNVSISPDHDTSPFLEAQDLLRLAVEVEAAALKEEAGAFLSVNWQAAPVEDPARSHLILRLAQEMLAAASREPIPVCLTVSGTGAVTLTLTPSEREDQDLTLDLKAPEVSGQLIEIDDGPNAKITVSYT